LNVFAALTHLGDTALLSVLCAAVAIALLALGRRQLAVGWLVAVTGSGLWHAR
jgi:undecaprenyl-diphosphatase